MSGGTRILWKCTIKRMAWIMLMAIISGAGIIPIQEYGKPVIGIILIFIGLALFIYKMLTWEAFPLEDADPAQPEKES